MAAKILFEVSIDGNAGNFVCTEPSPKVYLLTFTAPPDNRYKPAFNKAFMTALDVVEQNYPRGVLVTTSGISKFYSNGLDYESAVKDKTFFGESMYPIWRRLITYPMPTVALINGHAFAAGLITSFMHDYRIMNPQRGYLCMNEIDFGAPLNPPMTSVFRQKLPRADTYRTLVLEGKRFPANDALKEGLVDGLGGLSEALAYIEERKLTAKGGSGVYGVLKAEMWRETVSYLEEGGGLEEAYVAAKRTTAEAQALRARKSADAFTGGKAKL